MKKKRPIGITIISALYLWGGSFGVIFWSMPGGIASLADVSVSSLFPHIESELWLGILSGLLQTISLLFYVFAAVIGYGLWKLRAWAYRSLVAFLSCSVFISVLALSLAFGLSSRLWGLLVSLVTPSAWLYWYLRRRHVQASFGIISLKTETEVGPKDKKSQLKNKFVLVACVVGSLVAFVSGISIFAMQEMRDSVPCKQALQKAEKSPCVIREIGVPLESGWWVSGELNIANDSGSAELTIPIHGAKGEGRLLLSSEKKRGGWEPDSFVLQKGDQDFNLLIPDCQ